VAVRPFPARIRIDESGQRPRHEVVSANLAKRAQRNDVAQAVPMPPPGIALVLTIRRAVIDSSLNFAEECEESLVGQYKTLSPRGLCRFVPLSVGGLCEAFR
jgi:hypothetical protein